MNIKVNDIVEFYLVNEPMPKKGMVVDIMEDHVWVKVQHGELHNQEIIVHPEDIIDDSFDEYGVSDEKLYAWYDGE
jgi:hypothetical protein